jgi:hypothetical protein
MLKPTIYIPREQLMELLAARSTACRGARPAAGGSK